MPAVTVSDISVLPRLTTPDPVATRQRPVRTGAAMRNLELIEARDRRHDRRLAIVDVVGEPHCMNTG